MEGEQAVHGDRVLCNDVGGLIKAFVFIALVWLGFAKTYVYASCLPSSQDKLVYVLSDSVYIDEVRVEEHLRNFYSQKVQIVVIITDTLCGMDIAMYANTIGEKWGVGTEGWDDGVVIVVVPKTKTNKGALFVATGRRIQGALPDALVKRLTSATVDRFLKKGEFTEGLIWITQQLASKVVEEQATFEEAPQTGQETESTSIWYYVGLFFIFIYGFFVYLHLLGQGGVQGANLGLSAKGLFSVIINSFKISFSWAIIVFLIMQSIAWAGLVFVGGLMSELIGSVVLGKQPKIARALVHKTSFVITILMVVFDILARSRGSGTTVISGSGTSSSPKEPFIKFGGGRFNGGGAGSSW